MREFTCVICGAKGIDRSATQRKKYCSTECANKARYCKRGNEAETICKFNDGVQCVDQQCERCGWNPAVEQRRKENKHERNKQV